MRRLKMYQIDAFTDRVFGGNPAAVMVLDEPLDEGLMQSIAAENNLAETAFAVRAGERFALRWFTPVHEAGFCGHATLATAHCLMTEFGLQGRVVFDTQAGELVVEADGRGYRMDLPVFPYERLDPAPDWAHDFFGGDLVSAFRNVENLFVELGSEAAVRHWVPELGRVAAFFPLGLCITGPGEEVDFVSRYFAPGAGIPEDPVTGSTHATLVPFWADRLGKTRFTAIQRSARGGRIEADLAGARVVLRGQAVTYMAGEICVP